MTKRSFSSRLSKYRKKQKLNSGLAFHYYGRDCGPNYSDGRYQGSTVLATGPSVDDFDAACRRHDQGYALNSIDRATLDFTFAADSFRAAMTPTSLKKTVFAIGAGVGVGLQGVARRLDFLEDDRVMQIDAGPRRLGIDPPKVLGPEVPHRFPILKMPKYAARKYRKRTRKPRMYAKRKRTVVRTGRRYNKRSRTYRRSRRGRRGSKSAYANCSLRQEYGAVASDANIVVVGHGTNPITLLKVMCQTFVKTLFQKHGQQFAAWTEIVNPTSVADVFSQQVVLTFRGQESSTNITNAFFNLDSSTTYESLSLAMANGLCTVIYTNRAVPVLQRLELFTTNSTYTDKHSLLAAIDLTRAKFNWKYSSSMRLQNRTANAAPTPNSSTDVNNVNPVEGKCYYGKYGSNHFTPYYKPTTNEGSWKAWCPIDNYGTFVDVANNHPADPAWKELPTKGMVNAHKVKPFAVHPGQVMVDSLSSKGTILCNNLLYKMLNGILRHGNDILGTKAVPVMLGAVRAYAFDKLIWDRSETALVTIGFETNVYCSGTLSFQKLRTSPVTDIYPAPPP